MISDHEIKIMEEEEKIKEQFNKFVPSVFTRVGGMTHVRGMYTSWDNNFKRELTVVVKTKNSDHRDLLGYIKSRFSLIAEAEFRYKDEIRKLRKSISDIFDITDTIKSEINSKIALWNEVIASYQFELEESLFLHARYMDQLDFEKANNPFRIIGRRIWHIFNKDIPVRKKLKVTKLKSKIRDLDNYPKFNKMVFGEDDLGTMGSDGTNFKIKYKWDKLSQKDYQRICEEAYPMISSGTLFGENGQPPKPNNEEVQDYFKRCATIDMSNVGIIIDKIVPHGRYYYLEISGRITGPQRELLNSYRINDIPMKLNLRSLSRVGGGNSVDSANFNLTKLAKFITFDIGIVVEKD